MALWVSLTSAVVAALTAVGTTFVTQRRTTRRDDVRWERERADRREQWRREDEARWLADRRRAYADLLTALHEYETLTVALTDVRGDADDRARLRELRTAADRARQAVLLIAPPAVATAALEALRPGEPTPDGLTALYTAMRADLGVAPSSPPAGSAATPVAAEPVPWRSD
jgi:hypothetical protein